MTTEMLWRFLIVDDKQANELEEIVKENKILEPPHRVVVEKCSNFRDAIPLISKSRIDLVILDLYEEKGGISPLDDIVPLAGEKVFNQICQERFIPVVFYTAYPHKVEGLYSPYVQIIRRGNSRKLREAIKKVYETGLPQLIRFLEEEQRRYMWENVDSYLRDSFSDSEKTDATFLLARRLANVLGRSSVEDFLISQNLISPKEDDTIYPIEMYVYPSVNSKIQVGDILKSKYNKVSEYWMVMTPSCDLEQNKVTDVVLAACFPLSEQPEYTKVKNYLAKKEEPSNGSKKDLETLIGNNRNAEYKRKGDEKTRFQPERYSFLPGTFFIPDLVVDFQALIQISLDKIKLNKHRIASLDTPFAESCSSRFSRYYGRLGTPDIYKKFVSDKIIKAIQHEIKK